MNPDRDECDTQDEDHSESLGYQADIEQRAGELLKQLQQVPR